MAVAAASSSAGKVVKGESLMQVDGSLPLGATMIPCVGALSFWAVFGWGGLNFGWIIGSYTLLLAMVIAATTAWWTRCDRRETKTGNKEGRWSDADHRRSHDVQYDNRRKGQRISMSSLMS